MSAGDCLLCAAYERLREHALSLSPSPSGHFGLVVLMREGLAAWIARCADHDLARTERAASHRSTPTPSLAVLELDDAREADLVGMLANLVQPALRALETHT